MIVERCRTEVRGSLPAIVRNDAGIYEGDLRHYFRTVFYRAQNLNHPYHNFRHLCHVLWLCHDACVFYGDDWRLGGERGKRSLLIAAILHDFDHLGLAGPDRINIEKAVRALQQHRHRRDMFHLEEIEELIRLSEYPYRVPTEEVSLLGQILREADTAQSLDSAWIQQVVFGLAKEWGKPPLEVLEMQEGFLGNIRFVTEWGQGKYPPETVKAKIVEAQELVELLV